MTEGTDYAAAWRPDPLDEIEGRVVQVDARESEYGVYPILTLEDEGGTQLAVHCVHSILRREIARRYEPTQIVGAPMKIRYDGKKKTADGKRDYHAYTVFGGNRASMYDWSADLPEDERKAQPAPASQAPLRSEDLGGPLPPKATSQQKAAETFGEAAPF